MITALAFQKEVKPFFYNLVFELNILLMKNKIRKQTLAQRKALSKQEFWQLNDDILSEIEKIDWSIYRYVHLFLPIKENNEIDTFEIISYFKNHYPELKIVIPRTDFSDLTMESILFDHEYTILQKNKFNIPEPVYGEIVSEKLLDVVLIPLLAFDTEGNRIGYGGGFYDRFLNKCRKNCIKIGLSLFAPLTQNIDSEQYDIKLDICITPGKTYFFEK